MVFLRRRRCWYTDSRYSIVDHELLTFIALDHWGISVVGVAYVLCKLFDKIDSTFRIVTWTGFSALRCCGEPYYHACVL